MHPVEVLTRLGGVRDYGSIARYTSRSQLLSAVRQGLVLKVGRGSYALPTAQLGLIAAQQVRGVASHESAATYHGWAVKLTPERPSVIVPRHRKVKRSDHPRVQLWFRDLDESEHDGLATRKVRTVIDCARDLPFDQALAVADSALRSGSLDHDDLVRAAQRVRTNGRNQVLRVVAEANAKAANPFESVLRAIVLGIPGLRVEPQVAIREPGFTARPDLVDEERRIVIEADSFEFHSSRAHLAKDTRRYTNLVVRGWRVVRFSWEHVMFEPEWVRACLVALVEGPEKLATLPVKAADCA